MTRVLMVVSMCLMVGCGASRTVAQGSTDAGALMSHPDHPPHSAKNGALAKSGGEDVRWLGGAAASSAVLQGGSGETHLGLWVEVPESEAGDVARPPMALSLVIDASGSMAGEKIRHARAAAARMVEALTDGDLVSLLIFDDRVTELVAPTVVSNDSRHFILRAISEIRHGGSTNLYGAMQAAQRAVDSAPPSHPVRRVLVISDGIANVGPSSPHDFARLSTAGAQRDIQISAIGVGLGYDELTLGALAMNSEGRMHHLEHPQQMASILEKELDMLSRTVAVGAFVEITPAPGVKLGELANGRAQRVGRRMIVPLGTLVAGQGRELLIRATVPTDGSGRRVLADVRLVYEPHGVDATRSEDFAVHYAVSDDFHAVEASYDGRVEAMVASHEASEKQRIAAEMLNRGEQQRAAVMLQEAESQLAIAVDKAPMKQKKNLRRAQRRTTMRKQQAQRANSPKAQRAAALSSYDDAMDLKGY